MDALQNELSKIRPHVSSALPNQKAPALLLAAIEFTLSSQSAALTPVAYFAALVSTLSQTAAPSSELDLSESAVLPSTLYLLALVLPHVPSPVLRSQAPTVLPLLAPLLTVPALSASAPPLRSLLSVYAAWLPPLEPAQLSVPLVRQSFATVLEYALDPRPKVRKKAQEVVLAVIGAPPPPLTRHPYAGDVAEWVVRRLEEVGAFKGGKKAKAAKGGDGLEAATWCCAFVKSIAPFWPADRIADLVTHLLRLPALNSSYLTSNAYDLLATLLSRSTSSSSFEAGKIPAILDVVLSSRPAADDQLTAAAWLKVLEHGMTAYARDDVDGCAAELGKVWKVCWKFLEGEDSAVLNAACDALSTMARYCISPSLMEEAVSRSGKKGAETTLLSMIALAQSSLTNIRHARSVPYVLRILTSLLSRLRLRLSPSPTPGGRGPSVAQQLMMGAVKTVGGMRTRKGFEHRERADEVLGMALEVVGPEGVLEVLPLNLEPEKLAADEGRAYLLTLLRTRVTNAHLAHFINYFVPLSERLFNVQSKAEEEGRPVEQKVYSALVEQVWACFPAYCDMPVDLSQSFTPSFAQVLSQVLYTQPSMRPSVLRGLQRLVERSTSLAASSAPPEELRSSFGLDQADAQRDLEFLRGMAGDMLAVLFNVFGSVERDARGLVGDVISTYLGIADTKVLATTHDKVVTLLKNDMKKPPSGPSNPAQSVTHTMLDLLILFAPRLPPKQANSLFWLAASPEIIGSRDSSVQKKGYRLLARLVAAGKVVQEAEGMERLMGVLGETAGALAAAAKRDRLALLASLIPPLDPSQLHHIINLVPEAVLGTKETNEGARTEAFELLVQMGRKMAQGGVVARSMAEDIADATEVPASAEEFLTMVAAGLAGTTPHMISASITALARLVFEFKDDISTSMQNDLISTAAVFGQSKNREIVKSALGFIKVVVIALSVDVVRPHLPVMVTGLLSWANDHKFKAKVRHILERLIRRFGFEAVYNEADEEHKKLLTSIRKRKERSKRKKRNAEQGEDEDVEENAPRATTGNAFEDVLYGSESESEDDADGDEPSHRATAASKRDTKAHARLRMDDDVPMDLLHDAAAQLTSTSNRKRRKPGQDVQNFKTDDKGRLVINREEEDTEMADAGEGNAYLESFTSTDGFTRGRRGEVRFNKNTKKRRAAEDAEDVEMADAAPEQEPARKKRKERERPPARLGQEFRAKKAQGDARNTGQQEPYAYVSLAQAGSKRGVKQFNVRKRR